MRTKVSQKMLFTWLALAGLILLLAPEKLTSRFNFAFARLFRWPLSIGHSVSLAARPRHLPKGTVTQDELRYLNYIANLEQQVLEEHRKVEQLAGLHTRLPLEGAGVVPAEIVTASLTGSHSELVINRGLDDGLRTGQFVLANNGIIGTIVHVEPRQGRVRLCTDPASRIKVKVEGSKIFRVMEGTGINSAKISNVSTKHKIEGNAFVFAQKKPGLLDCPMVIGIIAECRRDDEKPLLWDITVRPVCDLSQLREVGVIVMDPDEHLRL